jgi:truncated hemoglobin YjbI
MGRAPTATVWLSTSGHQPDEWHPYQYARSNPITYGDPMGLFAISDVLWATGQAVNAYGWFSTANNFVQMAKELRDGASLRNVAMDFAINAALDFGAGKALGILTDAAAPLVNQFAQGFRKSIRKADDEIERLRTRAHAKPEQDHHLIPKGETRFTARYNGILARYRLDVDSVELPVIRMHHQGRHPTEYQQWVQRMLEAADEAAKGDKAMFLGFLHNAAEIVKASPELLMKDFWR